MLPPGIFLWDQGCDGLSEAAFPCGLAALHPSWASDVQSLEPWFSSDVPGFHQGTDDGEECEAPIVVCCDCPTTMDLAVRFAQDGLLPEWGSVVAVSQNQGRGQLRRQWVSPPGNLHASLVLPKYTGRHDLWGDYMRVLQPLLAGYVFAVALEQMGAEVKLKWPNDYLQRGRKVGGMLLEERNAMVVLGLGINLIESPEDSEMRKDHAAKAGKLDLSAGLNTPLRVWKCLVNRGKNIYTALIDAFSPSEFISLAAERLAWVGRLVLVREGGEQVYQARIMGLSPDGGLILDRNGVKKTLYSGSILPV